MSRGWQWGAGCGWEWDIISAEGGRGVGSILLLKCWGIAGGQSPWVLSLSEMCLPHETQGFLCSNRHHLISSEIVTLNTGAGGVKCGLWASSERSAGDLTCPEAPAHSQVLTNRPHPLRSVFWVQQAGSAQPQHTQRAALFHPIQQEADTLTSGTGVPET